MDDQKKTILKEVFGESSDSEEDNERRRHEAIESTTLSLSLQKNPTWESVKEIKSLWLCRDFLSPQQQSSLLSAIQNEGWFTEPSKNQAMRFGNLPSWAIELSNSIHEVLLFGDHIHVHPHLDSSDGCQGACLLPSDVLWREPLFDQLIANVYQPGEGICAHVDLMRFEDGIAIVSLESSCIMHFTKSGGVCDDEREQDWNISRIPVFLNPGSLVLLSGEARFLWKHEINRKPGFQVWEGLELNQKRRTSITLRKLCTAE